MSWYTRAYTDTRANTDHPKYSRAYPDTRREYRHTDFGRLASNFEPDDRYSRRVYRLAPRIPTRARVVFPRVSVYTAGHTDTRCVYRLAISSRYNRPCISARAVSRYTRVNTLGGRYSRGSRLPGYTFFLSYFIFIPTHEIRYSRGSRYTRRVYRLTPVSRYTGGCIPTHGAYTDSRSRVGIQGGVYRFPHESVCAP